MINAILNAPVCNQRQLFHEMTSLMGAAPDTAVTKEMESLAKELPNVDDLFITKGETRTS